VRPLRQALKVLMLNVSHLLRTLAKARMKKPLSHATAPILGALNCIVSASRIIGSVECNADAHVATIRKSMNKND